MDVQHDATRVTGGQAATLTPSRTILQLAVASVGAVSYYRVILFGVISMAAFFYTTNHTCTPSYDAVGVCTGTVASASAVVGPWGSMATLGGRSQRDCAGIAAGAANPYALVRSGAS
jgi:hypothetical protein